MNSSEAYLDSLLSALNEEKNNESEVEQDVLSVSDDPNKALSADEIATLFSQTNVDIATGEEIEEAEQAEESEPIEESEQAEESEPMEEAEQEEESEPMEEAEQAEESEAMEEAEELPDAPVSDDPNKALSADEIAALFSQANVDITTGEEIEEAEQAGESEAMEEPEEMPDAPVSDDPNKALSADEIAALFSQANVDITTGEEIEEAEQAEESEAMEEPGEMSDTPVSDDPSKALSADEIAALFAQADIDMETGENLSGENVSETEQEVDETEDVSIDDMLAQMEGDVSESQEEQLKPEFDLEDVSEEIEIDMDNPEEIELLLGLGERPDWLTHKAETEPEDEMKELEEVEIEDEQVMQSPEEILAAMSDENSDLQEINSLLNKLDNNELVGEGIEESVLVDFAETDDETEEDPWLDELLGNIEGKKKEKRKKSKKKFSWFGKKKEDNVQAETSESEITENVTEQESEEVTEILQNFSEDNAEIPFDLFAATEEEESEEELDLIALVEADNVKKSENGKKSGEGKGFFAKIWDILTEEVPEEEEKEEKNKKEKKTQKAKKNSKKAVTDADDNEGILEELDAEEDAGKKGKKAKKAKKEKKQKKPLDEESLIDMVQDSKKLPMKMVYRIFALCCSIMLLILLVNQFIPKLWSLADARNAFYKRDYETTYQEMSGKKLSESDQRLYEKSKMILQLNHKFEAYGNYKKMNMPVEALDSLLSGFLLWQNLADEIVEYDAVSETEEIKNQIVDTLSSEYQISEQDAEEINALTDYDYTLKLEEVTGSLSRQNGIFHSKQKEAEEVPLADEEMQQTEQQPQKPTENVLPEEEIQ